MRPIDMASSSGRGGSHGARDRRAGAPDVPSARRLSRSPPAECRTHLAAAAIDLDRGPVDHFAVGIENAQQAGLVRGHAGLELRQRLLTDKERGFHGTIVPPEPDHMGSLVVMPALVGETECHQAATGRCVGKAPWVIDTVMP